MTPNLTKYKQNLPLAAWNIDPVSNFTATIYELGQGTPLKSHFNLLFCGNADTSTVKSIKIAIAAIMVIPFPSFALDLVGSPVDRKRISFAAPPPIKLTIILTQSLFKCLIMMFVDLGCQDCAVRIRIITAID